MPKSPHYVPVFIMDICVLILMQIFGGQAPRKALFSGVCAPCSSNHLPMPALVWTDAAKALRILEPFDVLLNRAAAMSITSRSVLSPGIKRAISLTSTMLHPHVASTRFSSTQQKRLYYIITPQRRVGESPTPMRSQWTRAPLL